jgi:hypothetical protein
VDPQALSDVLSSLLRAAVDARGAMDRASAELAKAYWADPILRSLPLPAFTIPEMKVRLKFIVSDVAPHEGTTAATRLPDMRVIVDRTSLEKLPPHLVSEIELRLTPQMLRVAEAEAAEVPVART